LGEQKFHVFGRLHMWAYIIALVVVVVGIWKFFLSGPKQPSYNTNSIKFEPAKKITNLSSLRKEKPTKKQGQISVRFLFGSQTGTAEDFANILAEEATANNFFTEVTDLEDYDTDDLEEEELVIFLLATYGEGEPTDNAREFYEWIMDDEREEGSMSKVKYTVFGLGNKTFEHFNEIARKVDKRMEELGAERIFPLGEGDDDAGLQEDFDHWKANLWEKVCSALGIEFKETSAVVEQTYEMVVCPENVKLSTSSTWYTKGVNRDVIDSKNPALCRVSVNRELCRGALDRSCKHIEIELPENLSYNPGDHIGIFPENDPEEVNRWIERFKLDRNQVVKLVRKDEPNRPLLGPCTIERVLTSFVDILAPPRKKLLNALGVLYTSDEAEKERLLELGSSSEQGWKEYNDFIKNSCRTLLEVLDEFPSCSPSFVHMLELTPPLQHRFYSISSSFKAVPKQVHVTAVLVNYQTSTGRLHKGICTNWLDTKKPESGEHLLPCFIRSSTFRLPSNPATPIIMIGPGSGIAPFRGFLQERQHISATGEAILFFGCRNRDVDFLYSDELNNYLETGALTQLVTAFSRDTPEKVYVQHRMLEMKDKIWELLEQGAHVYVCGDAKFMAKDVYKALRQIVEEAGGKTKQQAESYITSLQTSNPPRYQQDVWA